VLGQPTEAALLVAAAKGGVEDLRHHFARLGEVPFSPTTKWMSVQYETGQQQPVYHVKGAVDRILERYMLHQRLRFSLANHPPY
jgi:magnesium-transporting ATPase (P-type)